MARASLVVIILQGRGRKVGFCRFAVFVLFGVCLFSGLGCRDDRHCVPRVRFSRCPASALKCIGMGPLGDASGNLSLVVASVNIGCVTIAGAMWMPLC